ncbi:winged helix-turn-helix transcriptional regulator [Kocuria koreensis]|jgi:DNA-binding Lrp family transcriptional regulator|uniref:Winged helix-turn-helix transcriptional regulator n=1 Tax=Rothia koreensis TaxID=592378 RepID=A0A7M3SVU2_9MICC|nr:Lrp/AsnC family transcriptional regulator [Rothia koreensis]MDN5605044.1 Lrp/AsnC family transcriptional regulator [Kocuria sp.]MDN5618040.1 Lrp/AsnC family transcriptional regulator [Kocuria sp.]MDN5653569.1 Lrp/AsnC family transcriptional regulator [Kocuria sp.]MUN55907.1 winged helix-turn-helix transcriptional regulator [Rothia koreensis]
MAKTSDLDRRLIAALRKDGRASIAALSEELGVSRATVTKRIDSLTARGIIVGFSVRVRDYAEASQVRAISLIEVEGRTTDHVINELRGLPEILALHTTNGGWDLVAEMQCVDLQDFDAVLKSIRGISGVVNSETSLLLSSVVR